MLTLDPGALACILEEAPRFAWERKETGGYLFGYSYRHGERMEVKHALGPGPNAVREWARLNPDHEHYHAEKARLEAQDEYLWSFGMWHTHPTGYPHPSPVDDEAAWWTLEHWERPFWVELIVIVDDAGAVTRICVYRYGPGRTREELPEIPVNIHRAPAIEQGALCH